MIIYIAGAITGDLRYRDKFRQAERKLQDLGHIVVNPAFLPDGLKDYLSINRAMIDQCDYIYVLKGSEKSKGTQKELDYCKSKGWTVDNGRIIYEK